MSRLRFPTKIEGETVDSGSTRGLGERNSLRPVRADENKDYRGSHRIKGVKTNSGVLDHHTPLDLTIKKVLKATLPAFLLSFGITSQTNRISPEHQDKVVNAGIIFGGILYPIGYTLTLKDETQANGTTLTVLSMLSGFAGWASGLAYLDSK